VFSRFVTTVAIAAVVTGCAFCAFCALMLASCGGPAGFATSPTDPSSDQAATEAATATGEGTVAQEDIGFVMGTVVYQTLYTNDTALPALVVDVLTQTEEQGVSWRAETSDIARVNAQSSGGDEARVSPETSEALLVALAIAADSGGAFDPTVGRLTQLWDFDSGSGIVPSDAQIQEALRGVGYEGVLVQGDAVTLRDGVALDFGAIGKGIGCDQALRLLATRADVTGAVINFGGSSILTYGQRGDGKDWRVALTNPTQTDDYLGVLELAGTNHVSTTGNYERYFEVDGRRYHHILDPTTGYPAQSGLRSVTVLCDSGIVSEGLSTACFVLGREGSAALLEAYGAEAVFVDDRDRVYLTEGIRHKFELLAEGYEVVE
jgi:thiamine biosynthesis lipoprotein